MKKPTVHKQEQPFKRRDLKQFRSVFSPRLEAAARAGSIPQHIKGLRRALDLQRLALIDVENSRTVMTDLEVRKWWEGAKEVYERRSAAVDLLEECETETTDPSPLELLERIKASIPEPFKSMVEGYNVYRAALNRALRLLDDGSSQAFFDLLTRVGPLLLREERVASRIQEWWYRKETSPTAKENLRKIGTVLAKVVSGKTETLLPQERKRKEKENNLQTKHNTRAVQYCDKAWSMYLDEKERALAQGVTDIALFLKIADNIERKEFSRGTPAKEEGKRLFRQRVDQDLASLRSSLKLSR